MLQYTLPIMIFIGCAAIALVLTIVLIFLDRARGGKLNASADERAARLEAEEADTEAKNQAAYGRDSQQVSSSPQEALLGKQVDSNSVNGSY